MLSHLNVVLNILTWNNEVCSFVNLRAPIVTVVEFKFPVVVRQSPVLHSNVYLKIKNKRPVTIVSFVPSPKSALD